MLSRPVSAVLGEVYFIIFSAMFLELIKTAATNSELLLLL